jgi:hypothetical protein
MNVLFTKGPRFPYRLPMSFNQPYWWESLTLPNRNPPLHSFMLMTQIGFDFAGFSGCNRSWQCDVDFTCALLDHDNASIEDVTSSADDNGWDVANIKEGGFFLEAFLLAFPDDICFPKSKIRILGSRNEGGKFPYLYRPSSPQGFVLDTEVCESLSASKKDGVLLIRSHRNE